MTYNRVTSIAKTQSLTKTLNSTTLRRSTLCQLNYRMDNNEDTAEVEWIVHTVKGQQFLKSRTVRIGDTELISRKSNINDTNINSQQQLPRSWTRLLTSHILLRNLNASTSEINHHLYFQTRLLFDDEPRHFLHLLEHGKFGKNNRISLDDSKLIRQYLQNELHSRSNNECKRFKSLADSSNRKRDRNRVENQLFLPELGSAQCNIQFFNAFNNSQLIATNYNRIVYGDHGPYIEFNADQINWDSFPNTQSKGDSVAYYDEFYAKDDNQQNKEKMVKLYAQRKTVHDQPNPPPGKYSTNHNRDEGYADYKIGLYYISPDDLWIDTNDNNCPYLYLLMMHNKDKYKQQQLRNKNISRSGSSKQFKRKYNDRFTRNQQQKYRLASVKEREEQKGDTKEMKSVYNPKILKIEIMKPPIINTREGKRVINACLNGDYIPGLIYIPNFITEDEEKQIKQELIDKSALWDLCKIQMKRRSLQFGYHLDYSSMELYKARERGLEEIPKEWQWIGQRIKKWMEAKYNKEYKGFNQLILNEYAPKQGIAHHTDRTHCFGPVVAGLSLFSTCVIEFKDKKSRDKNNCKPVLLLPRSVFIMTGASRYEWTHGIIDQKEHKFCGHRIRRGVRYSMTFRHAIDNSSEVLTRSSYNQLSANAMDKQ